MNTDRLHDKKWGVFTHYLWHEQNRAGTPANMGAGQVDWSTLVDQIDVERLARTLHEVGAGYYFITLMQGHKYMLAPNDTFDSIAGTRPGECCAERDIVSELYDALHKYDIDLYLYYTGDGPYKDVEVGEKFGYIEPRTKNLNRGFVEKWAAVLEDYSRRWGDKVKGWWIDGCYRYFKYNEELLKLYQTAVRNGNPDAIIAYNDGVKPTLTKDYALSDFTCGEFNDFVFVPASRYVDGAQAHILAPLGRSLDGSEWGSWCKPGAKRDGAYMHDYVQKVNAVGGVVTIDIIIYHDGSLDEQQLEVLGCI
mgnify:FL=1